MTTQPQKCKPTKAQLRLLARKDGMARTWADKSGGVDRNAQNHRMPGSQKRK